VQLAWLYRLIGFVCYEVFTRLSHAFSISAMVHLEFEMLSFVGSNHLQEFWKLEMHQSKQLWKKFIKKYFFLEEAQPSKMMGRSGRFHATAFTSDVSQDLSCLRLRDPPPSPFPFILIPSSLSKKKKKAGESGES